MAHKSHYIARVCVARHPNKTVVARIYALDICASSAACRSASPISQKKYRCVAYGRCGYAGIDGPYAGPRTFPPGAVHPIIRYRHLCRDSIFHRCRAGSIIRLNHNIGTGGHPYLSLQVSRHFVYAVFALIYPSHPCLGSKANPQPIAKASQPMGKAS
jgi:hypothetical protein